MMQRESKPQFLETEPKNPCTKQIRTSGRPRIEFNMDQTVYIKKKTKKKVSPWGFDLWCRGSSAEHLPTELLIFYCFGEQNNDYTYLRGVITAFHPRKTNANQTYDQIREERRTATIRALLKSETKTPKSIQTNHAREKGFTVDKPPTE